MGVPLWIAFLMTVLGGVIGGAFVIIYAMLAVSGMSAREEERRGRDD